MWVLIIALVTPMATTMTTQRFFTQAMCKEAGQEFRKEAQTDLSVVVFSCSRAGM